MSSMVASALLDGRPPLAPQVPSAVAGGAVSVAPTTPPRATTGEDEDMDVVLLGRGGTFRRSFSKPENPTSDLGASAIAAENRGGFRKSCQQLVLLRNFSVCEEDIVICNRVRCGVDPSDFAARSGGANYQRSLDMEGARIAALRRRRHSIADERVREVSEVAPAKSSARSLSLSPETMGSLSAPVANCSSVADAFALDDEISAVSPTDLPSEKASTVVADVKASNLSSSSTASSDSANSSSSARVRDQRGNLTRASVSKADLTKDSAAKNQARRRASAPQMSGNLHRPRAVSESAAILTPHTKDAYARDALNRYRIRDPFANGSYGKVCAAHDSTSQQEVAVKIVPKCILKSSDEKEAVVREQSIHKQLDHPHIVKLIDVFEDDGAHYFVLERADAGSLASLVTHTGIDEEECRDVFRQVLLALEYLHSNGIVHHDIKPHNVLLHTTDGIKLCDFGASRAIEPNETSLLFNGILGTPGYIAPELLDAQEYYGPAIDMYSAGAMLFELAFGYHAFYPPSACIYDPLEFPLRCTASHQLQDLLCRLMEKDPAKRITASEALGHPWLAMRRRSAPSSPAHCQSPAPLSAWW